MEEFNHLHLLREHPIFLFVVIAIILMIRPRDWHFCFRAEE